MTKVPLTWLDKKAIDEFIRTGRMKAYEIDCHKAERKLLLKVVARLSHKRKNFIIDINKRMVKDSYLNISPSNADREIFEFCMLDKTNRRKIYVGKKFTLVRGREVGENEEDRKRNISDEYKVSLPGPILKISSSLIRLYYSEYRVNFTPGTNSGNRATLLNYYIFHSMTENRSQLF